jgi:predicted DNA-binding transcriptional regulator YafY
MSTPEGNGARRRQDSQQLVRQWAILRLLADSGRSFSVKELSDQLRSSKATIQRDLATLEKHFALIEESVNRQKKVYRIDQRIRALQTLQFLPMELLAIHAALTGMHFMAGTPMHDDLLTVVQKLRGFLSPRHNGGLDVIARVFASHARAHIDHQPHREVIDSLVDAIARRKVCRVVYHSSWNKTTREHFIRPLRLVWHRSSLYLLAVISGKKVITTLAVQRFQEVEVTREAFATPKLDVDDHIRRAFGIFVSDSEEDVEILFEADIAWRIAERTYHPDERKTPEPDGRLRYQVRSSSQWEIVPWVLSFGPLATLVRPDSWRTAVIDALRSTLPRYAAADPEPAARSRPARPARPRGAGR